LYVYKHTSLVLAIIGLSMVMLSFILGGVAVLDAFILLLVPAFMIYVFSLYHEWPDFHRHTKIALILMFVCLALAFISKSRFTLFIIDDNYHTAKIVAYSIKNDFDKKLEYVIPLRGWKQYADARYFYLDYIECLWGLLWRLTGWEFSLVLLQGLPILLLWKQLVNYLQDEGVKRFAGPLGLATVLSMQVLWCQLGSGYIDAMVGLCVALVLVGCYRILGFPERASNFPELIALAFISSVTLNLKLPMTPVGVFGLAVAYWYSFRHLSRRQFFLVVLVSVAGLAYSCYHYFRVWQTMGHPLYPVIQVNAGKDVTHFNASDGGVMGGYFECHPIFAILDKLHMHFRAFYVLASWLFDYKYRAYVTPDPWVGGRGVLWTWLVCPTIFLTFCRMAVQPKRFRILMSRKSLILMLVILYVVGFNGTMVARFFLGFNIFIMAWALAKFGQKLEGLRNTNVAVLVVWLCVLLSFKSFWQAMNGVMFVKRNHSVLEEQRINFPVFVPPTSVP